MPWFHDPEDPRWKLQLRGTWQFGKESGYPWCCRLHFIVRGWLCNEIFGWGLQGKVHDWLNKFDFFEQFEHIPCPWHFLKAMIGGYKPLYGHCKPCDWEQLVTPPAQPCSRCFKMLSPLYTRRYRIKVGKRTVLVVRKSNHREKDLDS